MNSSLRYLLVIAGIGGTILASVGLALTSALTSNATR